MRMVEEFNEKTTVGGFIDLLSTFDRDEPLTLVLTISNSNDPGSGDDCICVAEENVKVGGYTYRSLVAYYHGH